MNAQTRSALLRWLWAGICSLAMLIAWQFRPLHAQTPETVHVLDWVEVKDSEGLVAQLHKQLNQLTAFFVRATSPDVPREARRIWKISVDGSQDCRVSEDTGVRYPRWGSGGYILYLQEADTNKDGRIDFLDDFLIRIVPAAGGEARTVAQGKSAVWSPDGHYIGFVRDGKIQVVTLQGEVLALGNAVPAGKIVATNARNPVAARDFWAVDSRSAAKETLPEDRTKKYLWFGALSPSGSRIVVANTMKTALEIREAQNENSSKEIAHGGFHFMDPAWSPDEKQIVYVSDRPPTGTLCRSQ